MKRTIFLLAMMTTLGALHAQPAANNYDTGFGLQIGYVNARPQSRIGSDASYEKGDLLNGIRAGLVHEVNFYKGLGLAYGLNYTYLGRSTQWGDPTFGQRSRERENAHHLDIPVNLQYKLTIARKTYLILNAGPDFDYCLSHTLTTFTRNQTLHLEGSKTDNLLKTDADADGIYDKSPFNLLFDLGIGFQFHNAQIKGGYSFGLLNTQKDTFHDGESKYWHSRQNEWNIRLIYIF